MEPDRSLFASLLRAGVLLFAAAVLLASAYIGPKITVRETATRVVSSSEAPPPPTVSGAEELTPLLVPETAAILKTKDALIVTVGLANPEAKALEGTLEVELLGGGGNAVGAAQRTIKQSEVAAGHRFEFALPAEPTDDLSLHCKFAGREFTVPVRELIVARAHETSVSGGQEFHAGSRAALRCGVHGVKSLTETIPLAGADVEVSLRATDRVYPLFKGKAGADGVAEALFLVPAVPPGEYVMVVVTHSELGEETLERPVRVRAESQVILSTDKPVYQPGQVMHIRGLALKPFDLTPAVGEDLHFEVEDTAGNTVLKKSIKTSEYGTASIDFPLAPGVNAGDMKVRAALGTATAQKTVSVKKHVAAKFKVVLTADRTFYLAKQTIHADLQANYFFGKPAANARVTVTASTVNGEFGPFAAWEGKTDAHGHARFDVKLPNDYVGEAQAKLDVKVTDAAGQAETVSSSFPISEHSIRVRIIPEGGRLVADLENRVFVAATYPDGSPALCTVRLWPGSEGKGQPLAVLRTSAAGLAEFKFTPTPEQFRQGEWEQQAVEMHGEQTPVLWGPRMLCDLLSEARDPKGNVTRGVTAVSGDVRGDHVLLRLDRAVYRAGDSMLVEVRASSGLPTVSLDVVRCGQTVLTRRLDVKAGQARRRLELPAGVCGTLEVHVYQTLPSGEISRDGRVVYVQPCENATEGEKSSRGPLQISAIPFVDRAKEAKALPDLGAIKLLAPLDERHAPQAPKGFAPAAPGSTLMNPREEALAQQIEQVLLTTSRPKPPARWEVAPAFERRQKAEAQVQMIGAAMFDYVASGCEFMRFDRPSGRWTFKPTLLAEMVRSRHLDGNALLDPFGTTLTLDGLGRIEKNFTADRLALMVTQARAQQLAYQLVAYSNAHAHELFKNGRWHFPETVLAEVARERGLEPHMLRDAWGQPFRLLAQDAKRPHGMGCTQFDYHELLSAGPDGQFGTVDDVLPLTMRQWHDFHCWWVSDRSRLAQLQPWLPGRGGKVAPNGVEGRDLMLNQRLMHRAGALPMPMAVPGDAKNEAAPTKDRKAVPSSQR